MLTTFQQSQDAFHAHEAHLDVNMNPSKWQELVHAEQYLIHEDAEK